MPATRRSSRAAAAKKSGRQSTLSFNNKVSKPGAVKASAKDAADAVTPPPSSLAKKAVAVDLVLQEEEDQNDEDEQPETLDEDADESRTTNVVQVEQRPAVEVKAERITDAQIKRYWRDVEDARIAKRVHQEDLSLAEKVLRYFDISSQYGVSSHIFPRLFVLRTFTVLSVTALGCDGHDC